MTKVKLVGAYNQEDLQTDLNEALDQIQKENGVIIDIKFQESVFEPHEQFTWMNAMIIYQTRRPTHVTAGGDSL